jgi:fluoroquinolone transport system permease protein
MRIKNLFLGDIKFQMKYGFYFVYAVLSILYIFLLHSLPESFREKAAVIMILTDPATLGLFFIGAIVLLEKSQCVLNSLAVSPIKANEFILSKVLSLSIISTIVGIILALAADIRNIGYVIIGTFLGAAIFTLAGLIIASKISTLNQFIITTVPIEIIGLIPPLFYLFGVRFSWMRLHPGCVLIDYFMGNSENAIQNIVVLMVWISILYFLSCLAIKKMLRSVGGVKL